MLGAASQLPGLMQWLIVDTMVEELPVSEKKVRAKQCATISVTRARGPLRGHHTQSGLIAGGHKEGCTDFVRTLAVPSGVKSAAVAVGAAHGVFFWKRPEITIDTSSPKSSTLTNSTSDPAEIAAKIPKVFDASLGGRPLAERDTPRGISLDIRRND